MRLNVLFSRRSQIMGKTARKLRKNREPPVRKDYEEITKENKDLEKYYKIQKICGDEDWTDFVEAMKRTLPTSFRITSFRSQAEALLYILKKKILSSITAQDSAEENEQDRDHNVAQLKAFPLPWYPDELAWHLSLTRTDIRRNENYYKLHNFFISETDSGNMSRQEAVSMIPPLVLDVKPHHKVLDMCAAPGSKTAQIIEMLHNSDSSIPEGFVIANDVDNKRCYMLVHQGKRLHSPCFAVTNHEAGKYPYVYLESDEGVKERIEFDRILCDVPCSGDGTIRKNLDIWQKWNAINSIHMNKTQYTILKRGLELLKVNGLLVYSTCSMNPIEDEAVIYHALKEADGSVVLEDINMKGLKHSKGLSEWTLCTRELIECPTIDSVPEQWKSTIRPHLFCPTSKEEKEQLRLDKCIRVLPHHQDTGGFFVALLRKVKEVPWKETGEIGEGIASNKKESNKTKPPPKKKPRRQQGFKEDPYIFLENDSEIFPILRKFYGLQDSLKPENFLTRNTGLAKNIYLTSPNMRNFVKTNLDTVKLINVGVKALSRVDQRYTEGQYRLCQEGLDSMLPYLEKRKVLIARNDLILILNNADTEAATQIESLSSESKEQLQVLDRGSVVLILETKVRPDAPSARLEIAGWKGINTISAYVQKNDRVHFLRLCGADTSHFEKNKFEESRAKQLVTAESNENGDSALQEDKTGHDM